MRLNGWQRLGIVASVVYALYGAGYEMSKLSNEQRAGFEIAYKNCEAAHDGDQAEANAVAERRHTAPYLVPNSCIDRATEVSYLPRTEFWSEVALTAFVPVVFGWIAALMAVSTVRWVWRGFKPRSA